LNLYLIDWNFYYKKHSLEHERENN